MDNENQKQPDEKRRDKWFHLGRTILVSAIITWCVKSILVLAGWDSWKTFSKKADTFTEDMLDGALRLSPLNLWNSITTNEHSYTLEQDTYGPFYPGPLKDTGKRSLKEKLLNWLGYYWYTKSGKPFWPGRIILILGVLAAISLAQEDYSKPSSGKPPPAIFFPFIALFKFFVFLLSLGLVALILYFVIKLLLFVVGGIVTIISIVAASGGFVKILIEEIQSEAASSSKKTIGGYLLPFLFRSKKVK